MSKRTTRLLSLILTLVMFLSVATPAYAWGPGDFGGGWDRDIGEDEIRDPDFGPVEDVEEYDYFQALDEENNVQVTIEAPMGSLPSLAEVRLEPVPAEDLQEAVEAMVEGNPQILVAMDISFWLGEDEIEPEEPVRVKISAPELEGKTNLQVIHFPDDAEEPETVQLIPEEDLSFALGTNEVAFQADSFSVYVVVDDGSEDDNARLEVNFFNLEYSEEPIATVYIKNSDLYLGSGEREASKSYIDDIVYDPGIGEGYQLGSNMFRGWTIDAADANPQPQPTEEEPNPDPVPYGANYNRNTKVYAVDDITKYLSGRLGGIKEGDVLNIYAMIFQTYTIAYYGMSTDVSMGMHTVFAPLNANAEAPYKIDMTFTPEDNEHFFEGWKILSGGDNIVSATAPDGTPITGRITIEQEDPDADPPVVATVFPDKSQLVVKGDVSFTVSQPAGHWLIFKENGKGARFNAPQFVKNGETTFQPTNALPANMTRNGYDFAGWYELEVTYDSETNRAIPVTDDDGNYVFAVDEFTEETQYKFGQTLSKETIIAARWIPRANSQYTVIIWQQKPSGDSYAFKEAIPFTGTTGSAISVITQDGATVVDVDEDGNPRSTKNVKVNGVEKAYEGFHVGSFDTGKTIAAEGNTVVNVYYDRNIVDVHFKLYEASGTIIPYPGTPNFDDGTTYYMLDPENEGYVIPISKNSDGEYVGTKYTDEQLSSYNSMTHSSGVNDSWSNTEYFFTNGSTTYYVWWSSYYNEWRYSSSNSTYGSRYSSSLFNSYPTHHYVVTNTYPAEGPYYYAAPSNGFYDLLVVYGRYGAKFTDGGYNWPTAYWWYSSYTGSNGNYSGSGTRTTFLDTFTPTTPQSMTINFYGFDPPSNANNHVYFYQEKADGSGYEVIDTVSVNHPANTNTRFNLSDKYTGFECVSWSFDGSTWNTVGAKVDDGNGDYYYDAYPNQSGYQNILYTADLHIRYDRLTFPISYFDGTYFDGNNNVLKDVDKMSGFGVVEDIMYGADITTYGQRYLEDGTTPNPNFNLPTREGYAFEGWYADETCSTPYVFDDMPYGGVTVFAKWRKVQYRVFLRTNVPTSDDSLDWGSDDQSMNFRITEGDYVSLPTGTRNGYVFVGWFYDDDFDDAFNSEVVPLTSDNVVDDYDKTARLYMTDNAKMITKPDGTQDNKPINKWGFLDDDDAGVNKDVNRFWITKKLDLYAKWKAILDGAEGISVLYDEVPLAEGQTEQSGHGVTGSAPGDGNRLYEDNSKAIAQGASKALAEDEQFLYWVVQKWDKDHEIWVDVEDEETHETVKVYPGDNFLVKEAYARITPDTANPGKNFYQVQLRAAYGKKDGPAPTHITWYSNIYDIAGNQFVDTESNSKMIHPTDAVWNENGGWYIEQKPVLINNAVEIPDPPYRYEGYTFMGWGRVCDPNSIPEGGKADITDPADLTENDLFIKWVADASEQGGGHYEAIVSLKPLSRDFYLHGSINGSDTGASEATKFVDNKLTMTFTQDSYIAVVDSNNTQYYTNGWLGFNATSATLRSDYGSNSNKLYVPAGTFTITLVENSDGSLTLGYLPANRAGLVAPLKGEDEGATEGWSRVEYVAADEKKPYHDMYAIWGGEFKVYHSGIEGGAVETYQITRANNSLDLTRYYTEPKRDSTDPHAGEYKDSGFLYGGYYLDGGFTAPSVDDKGVPTADCAAYDGTNWEWTKAETVSGMAIQPKGGVTYYIKEVPADKYELPYLHYTYKTGYDLITAIWLVSNIDDAQYKEVGFVVDGELLPADISQYAYMGKACNSLTITAANDPDHPFKLTPNVVFGVDDGHLTYRKVMSAMGPCEVGEGKLVRQYWVTLDNVLVTGAVGRYYTNMTTPQITYTKTNGHEANVTVNYTDKTSKPLS